MPIRTGHRPSTTAATPHMQLDQQPQNPLSQALIEEISQLDGVFLAWSDRAPPNTVGFFLKPEEAKGAENAFMLSTEFAHVHPYPDHSLHLPVPEPLRSQAIEAGWAEPHPLAGYPTISDLMVMVYAPRDKGELAVVKTLVKSAWANASGRLG
ncbi:hypothetical protein A4G20_01030 [Pasteurellaceae bacterium RH1A]|nr:hypothetical protein A4G20_01030 [Pasteurellaceae bacterium RH1A]